jgi:four helix bundle protein
MTTETIDTELLEWEKRQHEGVTGDPIWRLNCYREAMFLVEKVRGDLELVGSGPEYAKPRAQLISAVASVAANIAEGYGRPSVADRTRFFSYALGSTREAILWYQAIRPASANAVIDDRIARLSRIRRMVLGLLARLREKKGKKFDSW